MGSYMYRQRPNWVALGGAVIAIVSGALIYLMELQRSGGVVDKGAVVMIVFGTFMVTAICLMIAFARYRFPHLWKKNADHNYAKKGKHQRGSRQRPAK